MTLLSRLGLRRWLAHKVLGWEYVNLVQRVGCTRECVCRAVQADGAWWMRVPRGWLRWKRSYIIRPGGLVMMQHDPTTPHFDHRWHPLTPGVAGFYRGTETKP